MIDLLEKRPVQLSILLVLWATIYLSTLQSPAFFDDADSIHAESVREMVLTGDWTTLKINNGVRYLEKAPLMYWLSASAASLFGVTEWAIRLPLALFSLLLTLLLYAFGNRFFDQRTGFYAAIVYISSLGPFAFTRIFLPDVILAFFMTVCFYCYLSILHEPEPPVSPWSWLDPRCIGLYTSAALGVLTKGLIGIIFVGAVGLIHIIVSGRWDMLRRLQLVPGIVIFLLVGAPWHLSAGFANQGFFWFYFMNEHFLRYLGLRYPKDYDTVPLLLFWALHLVWLFPWSIYFWGFAKSFPRKLRPSDPQEQTTLFLYLWIGVILFFFCFSTTQEYYTFPTLPSFALLLGQVLGRLDSPQGAALQRKAVAGMGVLLGVSLAVGIGLVVLAGMGKGAAESGAGLTGTLTFNPEQYALSFGHIHDLTPSTFGHLAPLVHRTAILFLFLPAAAFTLVWRRRRKLAALCLACFMAALVQSYHSGMEAFESILSSRGLAKTIQYHHKPNDRIIVNGVYERGSSINFYTGVQLSVLNGHFGNLWYGSYFPDAPPIFFDDAALLDLWRSKERVFFFSEAAPFKAFIARHPDFEYRLLAEDGGKKVVVNW
ncbi:MAG: ArnT family glycosyltransferase [Syntrophobacteraceae bacterium]